VIVNMILANQGLKLPLAGCLPKAGQYAESNYTIIAIDFTSCSWASHENSTFTT